jgi:hypothetical protein
MIILASKNESEILKRLRELGGIESASTLTAEVITLKKRIVDLEIQEAKIKEAHEREDRELRHMIGLEKNRQAVEIAQAKRETELDVREGNLKAERERFEEHLKFNTERFTTMEKYLKEMFSDVLKRLPDVNLEITKRAR